MKIKLIVLLMLLAIPSVAFGAAGLMDGVSDYLRWLYPAYLYNLKFGIGFLIGFTLLYFDFKKRYDKTFYQLSQYLRSHPALAIMVSGVLVWMPFGILLGTFDYFILKVINWDWIIAYIIVGLGAIFGIVILLACGRFRNKVLISPLFLKVLSAVFLSAICASLLFIVLTEINVLHFKNKVYCVYNGGYVFSTHPFDSLKGIWHLSLRALCLIPISLLIFWAGNGYRWFKDRIKHKVALQKLA